jgi:lactoylglutathione lyase
MDLKLAHLIKFVSDMDKAVAFHRDVLGLPLRFASPGWSEFSTGETTLALHPASDRNPAGTSRAGFHVDDLKAFYAERDRLGLIFSAEPAVEGRVLLAHFLDSDGAECTISGPA